MILVHIFFEHRDIQIKNETKSEDEYICTKEKINKKIYRISSHLVICSLFFPLAISIDHMVGGLCRKLLSNYFTVMIIDLAALRCSTNCIIVSSSIRSITIVYD